MMEISAGQLFLAGFALSGPGPLASFYMLWFGLDRRGIKWLLLLFGFVVLPWAAPWLVHALSQAPDSPSAPARPLLRG
jgi:hypothetical protein